MSDIVDLKAFKKKKTEPTDETLEDVESTEKVVEKKVEEVSFEETLRRNEENRQRMKKEREKANKGVIRSYRLKH